jgi:hypothetical protein
MADSRYGESERPAHLRSDSIFDDGEDRRNRGGGGSGGGFFQRAGEEVRSWFGDDGDRGRPSGQTNRSDYGAYHGGSSEYDRRETWRGGSDWSGGGGASGGGGRGSSTFDDHYLSWRERQIRQLDQDYEDYCRDRQQQFESDFHGWRQSRQGQSADQSGAAADQAGATGQPAGRGATTGISDGPERSAATTAGGGGEASATESSTGSSATTGSGARTGRKSQDKT